VTLLLLPADYPRQSNTMSKLAFLIGGFLVGGADAWGVDGHTIVAHIADHYLSPEVSKVLHDDLYNVSLNNASDWNDDFDHTSEGRWSAPLHFINYKHGACSFNWARDCEHDWCNAGAIVNYSRQIFDPSVSKSDRFIALKFVVHMMGDIHQPLHVADGSNRGGNMISIPNPHSSENKANWSGRATNLHAIWDDQLLVQDIYDRENAKKTLKSSWAPHYHDWSVLADVLEKRIDGEWAANKTVWQAEMAGSRNETKLREGLSIVAQESAFYSCKVAYHYANGSSVKEGDVIDRDYFLRARPVIEEQLAKGGVRLAVLLQESLSASRERASKTMIV